MMRRALLRMLAATPLAVGDGLRRPLNAPQPGQVLPGVQPGVSQATVIANRVIVFGAGGGIFVYSGTPAAGNLIETAGIETGGTDVPGNAYLAGDTTYLNTGSGYIALQKLANGINELSAATYAGPYNAAGSITYTLGGQLFISNGGTGSGITLNPNGGAVTFQGNIQANDAVLLENQGAAPAAPSGAAALYGSGGHAKYEDPSGATYDTGRVSGIAAGQTVSSTTFTPLTGMSVALGTGTYTFRAYIFLAVTAAAGQWETELLFSGTATTNYSSYWTSAAGVSAVTVDQTSFGIGQPGPSPSVLHAYWQEYVGTVTVTAAGSLSLDGLTTVAADTWVLYSGSYLEAFPVV